MKTPRVLSIAVACLWLAGCGSPKHENSFERAATFEDGGDGYVVRDGKAVRASGAGLTFSFDPGFPEAYRAECMQAAQTFNTAIGREVLRISQELVPYNKMPDGRNVISYGKSLPPDEEGHTAETQMVAVDGRIVEADIDFDTRHFGFSTSGEPGKADVRSVCLHEMGHALGLAHSSDPASTMYPVQMAGTQKRTLSPEDITNLLRVYALK